MGLRSKQRQQQHKERWVVFGITDRIPVKEQEKRAKENQAWKEAAWKASGHFKVEYRTHVSTYKPHKD